MTNDDFFRLASISPREAPKRKKGKQKRDKKHIKLTEEDGKLTASSPELNGGEGNATETEARSLCQVFVLELARHGRSKTFGSFVRQIAR